MIAIALVVGAVVGAFVLFQWWQGPGIPR
jgi:hypothetical protein